MWDGLVLNVQVLTSLRITEGVSGGGRVIEIGRGWLLGLRFGSTEGILQQLRSAGLGGISHAGPDQLNHSGLHPGWSVIVGGVVQCVADMLKRHGMPLGSV